MSVTCPHCGGPVPPSTKGRKWCSDRCRKTAWNRTHFVKACPGCGTQIKRSRTRCLHCHFEQVEAKTNEKFGAMERLWAEGLTEAEIAERLGMKVKVVGVQIQRAKGRGFSFPYRRAGWTGHRRKPGPETKVPTTHVAARNQLRHAVRTGRVAVPSRCERCGALDARLDGHHHDYSKPLDVEWLCRECHMAHHRAELQAAA